MPGMPSTIDALKHAGEKIRIARYHWLQNRLARKVLRQIASGRGKKAPAEIAKARAYAREVLGWSGYAPWLYVYTTLAGGFREGWLPDNYYGAVVVPRIQGAYGGTSHLKALHPKLFNTQVFPDLAYRVGGRYFSGDHSVLGPGVLKELLFSKAEKVVFKADHSFQGMGIRVLTKESFDICAPSLEKSGVFQAYIAQHPFFTAFSSDNVASLRLTTVCTPTEGPSLRAAYLRLGRKGESHVRSASHIRVAVDPQSGALQPLGYLPSWVALKTHPDSGTTFEGKIIPHFSDCVQTILALHGQVPFVQCVGWDVVINSKGKVNVMEWNGAGNDIKFSEATQGPCFTGLDWETLWRKTPQALIGS